MTIQTTNWVPPRYWRVAIPFVIIFFIMITVLNLFLTAQPQLAIRESCIDLGFEPDCTEDKAINAGSAYNIKALIVPGFITLITVGLFGASQNQLGRPVLLAIAIGGQLITTLAWSMIYLFENTHSSWQLITIIGASIQACAGSYLVLYLAVFGVITDLSSRHPEKRVYYYVVFDLFSGLCTIIGTQLAAQLLKTSPAYLTIISASLLGFLILFTIFALPETIPPILSNEAINWKRANIIVQMNFLFHKNSFTNKLLTKDAVMVYNKIKAVYEYQNNLSFSEPFVLADHQDGNNTDDNTRPLGDSICSEIDENLSNSATYHSINTNYPSIHNNKSNQDTLSPGTQLDSLGHQDPSVTTSELTYNNPQEITTAAHDQDPITASVLPILPNTKPIYFDQQNNSYIMTYDNNNPDMINPIDVDANMTTRANDRSHPLLPYPSILPPIELPTGTTLRYMMPRNGIGILLLSLGINMLVFLGHKICDLYFLKHKFNIGPQSYSNLLSLSVLVRSLVAMVFFPLFKKYITTPREEIIVLYIGCAIQGFLYLGYPFMPTFTTYCTLSIINYCVSVLPTSIVRSAASNHVSEHLQQYVLSALVASEVLIILFGGICSNVIWLLTSKTVPGMIYIICGLLSFLAALVLFFFLQDSPDEYNLRIAMTTQYVRYHNLELKQNKLVEALLTESNDNTNDR